MPEEALMSTQPGKKGKRFLAPQEKYEIWMQLVRGETTVGAAADGARVDSVHDREVAGRCPRRSARCVGAVSACARDKQRDLELEVAHREAERLRTALAEMAVRLTLAEGKDSWG